MAGIADVFAAFQGVIAGVIYPDGPPPAGVSTISVGGKIVNARIFAGWPIPANLDTDIAAGIANVSLYVPKGMWRNTTRYPQDEIQLTSAVHTITAIASGSTVTLSGTPSTPQNVAIITSTGGAAYGVQPADTLNTIAAGLAAALVAAGIAATAIGAVVNVPGAVNLHARVGGSASTIKEVMRQEQRFQVTVWAPQAPASVAPDAIRTAIAEPIKIAFASLKFVTLADNSAARVVTAGEYLDDDVQKPGTYIEHLFYQVEYPTTETQTEYEIVMQTVILSGGLDPTAPLIGTYTY